MKRPISNYIYVHFLPLFAKEDYVLKHKSRILLWFNAVSALLAMFFCIHNFLSIRYPSIAISNKPLQVGIAELFFIFITAFCIFLLKKGRYIAAVTIDNIFLSILLTLSLVIKIPFMPHHGTNSFISMAFVMIVFSGFFGTRKMYIFTSLYYMLLIVALAPATYYYAFLKGIDFSRESRVFLLANIINSEIAIVVLTLLTSFASSITNGALLKARSELAKNKKLNMTLEDRVLSRTEELKSAMEKLSLSNNELMKTRDALWGEMQLAKKLQVSLLPDKLHIPGYQVDAYINPTNEIGGDYYDIITQDNVNWIIIGDVSGHGVSAGLIMMMVQTAIHVVLSQNVESSPAELLSIINKTIYANISKFIKGSYMTITVLAEKDGDFIFSGLHQDILVYRNISDKVESLTTDGIWLGLKEDIGPDMKNYSFTLNKDDVLFLYTDGITEAWGSNSVKDHRNPETDMYGIKRLISCFQEYGSSSVENIKAKIIESLKGYETDDDVTLLLIKKM